MLLLGLLVASAPTLNRDAYGIAHIQAPSVESAFHQAGFAVAQDRLWQMEMSRRVARGRMAEIMGRGSLASDTEIAKTGATDAELREQFSKQPVSFRTAWQAYADGVNEYIASARSNGGLPSGYADHHFEPEPWTPLDSSAIGSMLGRRFGGGGGIEVAGLTLLNYLQGSPAKDQALDVFDDLAWQNESKALCTVNKEDEKQIKSLEFPVFTHDTTLKQQARLPKLNVFELLPAIKLADMEDTKELAMSVSAPYHTGSYCVVVGKNRAANHAGPLLLSGPQMGFQIPSIVHEIHIDAPGYQVSGMDVPGIPGVLIGTTPKFAWGLTTGVSDLQDVISYSLPDEKNISVGRSRLPLVSISKVIKVADSEPVTVVQEQTPMGPVILKNARTRSCFALRSGFRGHELDGYAAIFGAAKANSPEALHAACQEIPLGFNLFYAFRRGDIGWMYCGWMPKRPKSIDPRLPMPAEDAADGEIHLARTMWMRNPKNGLIFNWNNKPISWWQNGDTPVWGELFRNQWIKHELGDGPVGISDLEKLPQKLAQRDDQTMNAFLPFAPEPDLQKWDGRLTDGSKPAYQYVRWVSELRKEIFTKRLGSMGSPTLFNTVLQPSLMLRALSGKTKVDYLMGRSADSIAKAAWDRVPSDRAYLAGRIPVPIGEGIPYSNRGTYLQVVDLSREVTSRTVNVPGVAETGDHAGDQVELSRKWGFKDFVHWK